MSQVSRCKSSHSQPAELDGNHKVKTSLTLRVAATGVGGCWGQRLNSPVLGKYPGSPLANSFSPEAMKTFSSLYFFSPLKPPSRSRGCQKQSTDESLLTAEWNSGVETTALEGQGIYGTNHVIKQPRCGCLKQVPLQDNAGAFWHPAPGWSPDGLS